MSYSAAKVFLRKNFLFPQISYSAAKVFLRKNFLFPQMNYSAAKVFLREKTFPRIPRRSFISRQSVFCFWFIGSHCFSYRCCTKKMKSNFWFLYFCRSRSRCSWSSFLRPPFCAELLPQFVVRLHFCLLQCWSATTPSTLLKQYCQISDFLN